MRRRKPWAGQAAYDKSAAGKLVHHRYYTSAKGRETGARYKRFRRRAIKLGWRPAARQTQPKDRLKTAGETQAAPAQPRGLVLRDRPLPIQPGGAKRTTDTGEGKERRNLVTGDRKRNRIG